MGSRVAPSNLPVIRRRCCSALLARQGLDLLSLFISFSRHLPWCHFCSPELAYLPRVSLKKWACIIYQDIFQLPSRLSRSLILLFHLFLSCLVPPVHLSSTQGFPLLLREVCFTNHFPACHPLTPSFSFSTSVPPPSPSHREPVSLALNHCVSSPLKTREHFFSQTARSDLLAGGTSGARLSAALLHPPQRQRRSSPGAEPQRLAARRSSV